MPAGPGHSPVMQTDEGKVVVAGRVPARVARLAKAIAAERGEPLQDLLLRALVREIRLDKKTREGERHG